MVVRAVRRHAATFLQRERRRPTPRCQGRRTLTEAATKLDEGTSSGALLAARGVGRRYGSHRALAGADLAIAAGEAVALVGPNGAGKSTLLSILAGALEPSDGTIVAREPAPRIGWVPQRPAQYGRLSARENLALFARLEGVSDVGACVARLLERVALPDDGRASAELSAGNQQRLSLALALLADPDVLLLDEPTAALDPGQRRRLWELVSDLKGRGGAAVFATQNLDEVEHFADRVVVLDGGEIVFDGALDAAPAVS